MQDGRDHISEPNALDFRESAVGRRQGWYGLKKHVKRALAWRVPHLLVRAVARVAPRVAAGGRLPAPARLREVQGRALDATFVMLRPDRCIVAKELYWGKGTRPKAADAYAVELFARRARESDVILDIGAYTGLFTLVSALVNPAAEVHAFEIVPDVFKALFDNCVRNDVLDRVSLHCVGIGDPDVRMRVPSTSAGSALPDFYSERLHFDSGPVVRFRSLDSLVPTMPDRGRVLVKIDVEGTEDEVFRHGVRFLETFGPDILCEILPGAAVEEIRQMLRLLGYRFLLVRRDDLLSVDRIESHPIFRDWFFSRRSAEELLNLGIPVERSA